MHELVTSRLRLNTFPRVNPPSGPTSVCTLSVLATQQPAPVDLTNLWSTLTLSNRYLFIILVPLVKRKESPGTRTSRARLVPTTPRWTPRAPLLFTSLEGTLTDIIRVGEVPTHRIMVVNFLSSGPRSLELNRLLTIMLRSFRRGGLNRPSILAQPVNLSLPRCRTPARYLLERAFPMPNKQILIGQPPRKRTWVIVSVLFLPPFGLVNMIRWRDPLHCLSTVRVNRLVVPLTRPTDNTDLRVTAHVLVLPRRA